MSLPNLTGGGASRTSMANVLKIQSGQIQTNQPGNPLQGQPDSTDTMLKRRRAQMLASMVGYGTSSTLSTGGPVAASYGQPLKTLLGS
ncbi:MAG TPA: hypothetical protein VET26_00790 [Candidatus Sulfotelmatobacter sp.]|nr:hypothetical protein [Candidatus Sulfotelmatobacter sp.]